MGKGKKYEYEDLIPIHQELAKKVLWMKVAMGVLSVLGFGVLIGVLIVNTNNGLQKNKVQSFEPFPGETKTEDQKKWDVLHNKIIATLTDVEKLLSSVYNHTDLDMLYEHFDETKNPDMKDLEPKVQRNINETKKQKALLDTFAASVFVPGSDPKLPRYYSKYLAGYVGAGCDASTCSGTPTTKPDLKSCIADCYGKRKSGGVFSVSYQASSKKCHCSTNKYDFVAKTGYLHYRFPIFYEAI